MKKRQFRYVLSFLILTLTLFVFATLADSQESTEQITEEPNPTEQSSEESKPPESQLNTLKENIKRLEYSFSIFVIIIVAFVILISAFVIFWGKPWVRQQQDQLKQQDQLNKNNESWQGKFNDYEQNWKESLELISQQRKENTQKLVEMESNQSTIGNELEKFDNTIDGIGSRLEELVQTVADLESAREMNITPDNTVVYQVDVESTVLKTQARVEELERAYRDGEPIIDLDYIEIPIPSHNVMLNINWIAQTIREWITELEQSTVVNQGLIQTLKHAEQAIKDKLKTIREESMPVLKLLNLETDISTDMELGDIRDQHIGYPVLFKGVLIGNELGRKVDEAGSDQFIPQFIKNQLFNNVTQHIPHDQLPEQLDRFLQLADYEVIPIEVGKTEADARVHNIQGSKHTGVKRGTIAEVVSPGLMQKKDRVIVQKPVVIRGE